MQVFHQMVDHMHTVRKRQLIQAFWQGISLLLLMLIFLRVYGVI